MRHLNRFAFTILFVMGSWPFAGCGDEDDDGSKEGGCTDYERSIAEKTAWIDGVYPGTVSDSDGEIPCAHNGGTFELTLVMDPVSECSVNDGCIRVPYSCDISGSLVINGAEVGTVDGITEQPQGPSGGITVNLFVFPTQEEVHKTDDLIELSLNERDYFIAEGDTMEWSLRRSEDDAETTEWESCLLTFDAPSGD